MAKEKLVITLGTDGEVSIDAQGFQGKGCEDVTRAFSTLMGSEKDDGRKPEYYRGPRQKGKTEEKNHR